MLKKSLEINGVVYDYHTVQQFELFEDGTCSVVMGAYTDVAGAAVSKNPGETIRLRCDGVTRGEDILQQIYAIAASDARYAGAVGLVPDAKFGVENPRQPLPPKPECPSKWCTWDKESWRWVTNPEALQLAKAEAREQINTARNSAEREPFPAFGKPFDADDKAIQRIQGAVQAAMASMQSGLPLEIEWTCADNTTVKLSAEQLIQVPMIMVRHANALHQKARNLKNQITESDSLEKVLSVAW